MEQQNIVLAIPLEEELLRPLHHWGQRFDWSHVAAIHLVHVVKKSITPLEFGLMEMPDENTLREMRPTLDKFLREEGHKIIPPGYRGEVFFHLSADFNPSEAITGLIRHLKATLIVVSTRGKHGFEGLFHSSFTDHMIRFAPCDVYVVRPVTERKT